MTRAPGRTGAGNAGTPPSLAQTLRAAEAATAGRAYPGNPVLRDLIERRTFTHNGRIYRAAHRLEDFVCETMGRLVLAQGLQSCLEVGTLFGFATLFLAEAVAATGGQVDTVDIRPAQLHWDRHRASEPQTIENVHEVAERLLAESGLAAQVRLLAGDSNAVLPNLIREGRRYELALVDGAHDFPSVLLDVIAVDNLLVPGGYLVLDDVGRTLATREGNLGGPNRLLAALFASGRYEVLPLSANAALCRKGAE